MFSSYGLKKLLKFWNYNNIFYGWWISMICQLVMMNPSLIVIIAYGKDLCFVLMWMGEPIYLKTWTLNSPLLGVLMLMILFSQIENEFGSYGDDKAYLHHLVTLARAHLGEEIVL